jgi:hypothetical protein
MMHNPRTTITSTTFCDDPKCKGHVTTQTHRGRLVLTDDPAMPLAIEASTTVSPGGDEVAKVTLESVSVSIYRSPEDSAFVVEIDTEVHTGEVRVYVNDGQVFAADPEVG